VELNIVWQIDDGRSPGLLSAYRRGGGGSSAPPFRRWLAVVNKLVVILSENVEHERARAFVGSIVDGTAIAKKAVQKGRRKERDEGRGPGRRIRQRPTRLARPRVDAYIRVRPSSREIRLEEGTNQSSRPAGRWD
jgi:hypothetical protein